MDNHLFQSQSSQSLVVDLAEELPFSYATEIRRIIQTRHLEKQTENRKEKDAHRTCFGPNLYAHAPWVSPGPIVVGWEFDVAKWYRARKKKAREKIAKSGEREARSEKADGRLHVQLCSILGMVKYTVVPSPGLESRRIMPLWFSMMRRTMARPTPVPGIWVAFGPRWNRLKARL